VSPTSKSSKNRPRQPSRKVTIVAPYYTTRSRKHITHTGTTCRARQCGEAANAREVRLVPSVRGPRAEPEGPIDTSNRGARRSVVGSALALAKVGSVALQKSDVPLEHMSTPSPQWSAAACSAPASRGYSHGRWPLWARRSVASGSSAQPALRSPVARLSVSGTIPSGVNSKPLAQFVGSLKAKMPLQPSAEPRARWLPSRRCGLALG
jgi:hypothetical protein